MTRRVAEQLLATACLLAFVSRSVQAVNTHSTRNLLMVGNSFSEVHNLEEMIQSMLQERKMLLQAESVFAERFEVAGANMTHYADSQELAKRLADRDWTWVILQEQSQTPGFCADKPKDYLEPFNYSLASIMKLNDKIQDDGATTILYETWGYFDPDPYNPTIFPDYPTMQDKLTKGYQLYYDSIIKKNRDANVRIAPAGLAFKRVFDSIKRKGQDPYEAGSLFDQLFMPVEADKSVSHIEQGNKARKYPTLEGAYLCACVLFQTISGLDVRQSSAAPPGLDFKMRDTLQKIAYDTVIEFKGGTAINSHYEVQKTKPPYIPADESSGWSYNASGTDEKSSGKGWLMAIIFITGGVASYYVMEKRRSEITVQIPRNYGWNLLSSDESASMEFQLSDMPSSPNIHRV